MRRGYPLLVMMGLLVPMAAWAQSSLDVRLRIGDAPPPPRIVVYEEPHVVVVPGSTVYVVEDDAIAYDSFRYGVYWYVYNDGWWYRARSYRGPFRVIETRYVPRAIFAVPAKHWRHHPHGGPPGQMKKQRARGYDAYGRDVVVVKEKNRGHGR
jgi:hypothetical protein